MKFRNKWRRPMPRESIIQLHVGVSGGSPMLDVPSRVRTKAIAHRLFACDFVDINGKFKLEIATNNTKERSSIKSNQQTILSWVSAVECCWAEEEEKKKRIWRGNVRLCGCYCRHCCRRRLPVITRLRSNHLNKLSSVRFINDSGTFWSLAGLLNYSMFDTFPSQPLTKRRLVYVFFYYFLLGGDIDEGQQTQPSDATH